MRDLSSVLTSHAVNGQTRTAFLSVQVKVDTLRKESGFELCTPFSSIKLLSGLFLLVKTGANVRSGWHVKLGIRLV